MTFSSPAVATSHYLGKTHAKNMKQQSPKVEGMTVCSTLMLYRGAVQAIKKLRGSLDPKRKLL